MNILKIKLILHIPGFDGLDYQIEDVYQKDLPLCVMYWETCPNIKSWEIVY